MYNFLYYRLILNLLNEMWFHVAWEFRNVCLCSITQNIVKMLSLLWQRLSVYRLSLVICSLLLEGNTGLLLIGMNTLIEFLVWNGNRVSVILFFFQANYLFLHQIKGTPWQLMDQGKARLMTAWEQIDYGQQFTTTRKFITIIPIVL